MIMDTMCFIAIIWQVVYPQMISGIPMFQKQQRPIPLNLFRPPYGPLALVHK